MKGILRIEEFFMLVLGFVLFMRLDLSVWWFFGLLLTPDIGMLGYLVNNKVGAICYNIFHHKGLAIVLFLLGSSFLHMPILSLIGIILFSHASMDRIFGYGLKYDSGFKFTHLGEIGKNNG
ncbi:MAG: DUF4260 domain-containing protein [Flavobacteriaceae bacterium]